MSRSLHQYRQILLLMSSTIFLISTTRKIPSASVSAFQSIATTRSTSRKSLLSFSSSAWKSYTKSPSSSSPFFFSSSSSQFLLRGGASLQASSSSSEVNGENHSEGRKQKRPTEKQGQTGWNHNQPSSSSDFWEAIESTKEQQEQKSSSTETNKTGWLHTNSVTAREKQAAKAKSNKASNNNTNEKGTTTTSGINLARRMLQLEKIKTKLNHRIISQPTFHPVGEGRRAVITEHLISVPLDHVSSTSAVDEIDPNEEMIDVYFSIVELITKPEDEAFFQSLVQSPPKTTTTSTATSTATATTTTTKNVKHKRVQLQQKRALAYKEFIQLKNANECCLYLQGGPGFGAPRPIDGIGLSDSSSWVGSALGKGFKRVVLMDQRGTGRSTPITKQTLEKKFPDLFCLDDKSSSSSIMVKNTSEMETQGLYSTSSDIEEQINKICEQEDESIMKELGASVKSGIEEASTYMTNFRADNIVKDAEAVKDALFLPLEEDEEPVPRPWGAALGQSFGGFCMMTYLSIISHPPKICLLTGGIAPMLTPVDEVYTRLRERVKQRNLLYYDRYPGDVDVVKRIVKCLMNNNKPPKLPSGGILTPRRFLQVGIGLGGSPSAFASLHSLFSSAFLSEDDDDFTRSFLKTIDGMQPFDDHPIYFLLHESIYADGKKHSNPTNWSAHNAYEIWNKGEFDFTQSCESDDDDDDVTLLFGEVVFPWMADGDYAEVSGFGMRALASHLATKDDWGDLYDAEQMRKVLSDDGQGLSKAAAAVYYDDMYVDFDCCMKVTKRGGPLEKCKVWVTNDYQHSGLRDDGAAIFNKLLGMAKGSVNTPS